MTDNRLTEPSSVTEWCVRWVCDEDPQRTRSDLVPVQGDRAGDFIREYAKNEPSQNGWTPYAARQTVTYSGWELVDYPRDPG